MGTSFSFILYNSLSEHFTPCVEHKHRVQGFTGVAPLGAYVPQCELDGSYSQVQCHSSTGYCWCVDEDGKERSQTRQRGRPNCTAGKACVKEW